MNFLAYLGPRSLPPLSDISTSYPGAAEPNFSLQAERCTCERSISVAVLQSTICTRRCRHSSSHATTDYNQACARPVFISPTLSTANQSGQ